MHHKQSTQSIIMHNPNLSQQVNQEAISSINKPMQSLLLNLTKSQYVPQAKPTHATTRTKVQARNPRLKEMLSERMEELYFLDSSVLTIKAFIAEHTAELKKAAKVCQSTKSNSFLA
jgi:hypothetical protein